jgi:type I restriction enzyme M protein
MDQATHGKIVSFIWNIADDVLRDVFVRGKYRDVILPMCVLRRLDAVLEPTKKAVLETKEMLDKAKITEQRAALCAAAEQAFYNTSKFTLRDLKARSSQQQLRQDFEGYLEGFSPNVQEILSNFEFRNTVPRLSKADALGTLIEKFLDPEINLSPKTVLNSDGSVKHPAMDNHAMGTVFEELVRKFNEENNEEAGEHWTPRDAVKLMADLILLPIADVIQSGSYLLYDGACGTGGMLTVAEERLKELAAKHGKQATTHLYGQEINPETFAICKADMLLKGKPRVVEYEPDSDLRDTEQVPLLEPGGVEAFFRREVLPYTSDAWINEDATKVGYEVSFTRHFYKPQALRTLEEIRTDILALEKETEGVLAEIIGRKAS